MRFHKGVSQGITSVAGAPNLCKRCVACNTTSGASRSLVSSWAHAVCNCALSCASFKCAITNSRIKLLAAVSENAPCFLSKRAVSKAMLCCRFKRVALRRKRKVSVRLAAPCLMPSSHCIACSGSRSFKAQRAAPIWAASMVSSNSAEVCPCPKAIAASKWVVRSSRSRKAWALSAAIKCAKICIGGKCLGKVSPNCFTDCKASLICSTCSADLTERT